MADRTVPTAPSAHPLFTWEDKRVHRLVHGLEATPEQRLHWLEEAIRLAYQVGALPKKRTP